MEVEWKTNGGSRCLVVVIHHCLHSSSWSVISFLLRALRGVAHKIPLIVSESWFWACLCPAVTLLRLNIERRKLKLQLLCCWSIYQDHERFSDISRGRQFSFMTFSTLLCARKLSIEHRFHGRSDSCRRRSIFIHPLHSIAPESRWVICLLRCLGTQGYKRKVGACLGWLTL